jgi:hypothetical protein
VALQQSRSVEVADALAGLCNRLVSLWAEVHQALEHNSDQAIDWAMTAVGPKVFTAANATDILTSTAHGLANGQKGRVSNAGGALPAGLTAGTDYFVIAAAANTFQLSATLGGAAVNFTTDGTGTHTFQPVPDYFVLEANGNLSGRTYAPAAVSNVVGSLDQFRRLLTNLSVTQGDHLGNLNQLARPLGG